MQTRPLPLFLGLLLTFCSGFPGAQAAPPAAPHFTLTATNVVMPATGLGSSHTTVTSVDGYSGSIVFSCKYTGPRTSARIPTCEYGPIAVWPLKANQTLKGAIFFFPPGSAIPLGAAAGPLRPAAFSAHPAERSTPGTYRYTITATNTQNRAAVSANITVRVP
jgi:hypothetical protein